MFGLIYIKLLDHVLQEVVGEVVPIEVERSKELQMSICLEKHMDVSLQEDFVLWHVVSRKVCETFNDHFNGYFATLKPRSRRTLQDFEAVLELGDLRANFLHTHRENW